MDDSIDIEKLLSENRERVIKELRQQDHQLGDGLSHIVAEIGRLADDQKTLLRRMDVMDSHTNTMTEGLTELRVSIAGNQGLGVRGLGERVKSVEQATKDTTEKLRSFENKTKGGIWIVSALATIGGLAGTFIGLWLKSIKGG